MNHDQQGKQLAIGLLGILSIFFITLILILGPLTVLLAPLAIFGIVLTVPIE